MGEHQKEVRESETEERRQMRQKEIREWHQGEVRQGEAQEREQRRTDDDSREAQP